ncbi:MAG: hypothetical protein PUD15_08700 [Prevotella sp.]|nr:hypothetical protein [Prevotella sp.]
MESVKKSVEELIGVEVVIRGRNSHGDFRYIMTGVAPESFGEEILPYYVGEFEEAYKFKPTEVCCFYPATLNNMNSVGSFFNIKSI